MQLIKTFILFFLLATGFASSLGHAKPLNILVSIKPFYNLAAAINQGENNLELLLTGNSSPHAYSLSPSQIKKIYQADLVIWGGPELETFLSKTIKLRQQQGKPVLTLATIEHLKLLPLRTSANWAHEHQHSAHEPHHHHHHHHDFDAHFWLTTSNASVIAKAIAQQLINIDNIHAAKYNNNLAKFNLKLADSTKQINNRLAAITDVPYLVFHDAYQYFEAEFNLHPAGAVVLNPEIPLSAARQQQLENMLSAKKVKAIFGEPQFSPKTLNSLLQKYKIKYGMLDPLGTDNELGPNGYFRLLDRLVDSLTSSLGN